MRLQKYYIFPNPPNFSAIFFQKKHFFLHFGVKTGIFRQKSPLFGGDFAVYLLKTSFLNPSCRDSLHSQIGAKFLNFHPNERFRWPDE